MPLNEDRKVQRGQMSVLGILNLGGWGDTQVEIVIKAMGKGLLLFTWERLEFPTGQTVEGKGR